MQTIYQVTIHGRILESHDLKKLLSRAVSEKRIMDRRVRMISNVRADMTTARDLLRQPAQA